MILQRQDILEGALMRVLLVSNVLQLHYCLFLPIAQHASLLQMLIDASSASLMSSTPSSTSDCTARFGTKQQRQRSTCGQRHLASMQLDRGMVIT